ncbi:MAG: hypothetical protein AAFU41_03895 [Pseudomonadota bacterium]
MFNKVLLTSALALTAATGLQAQGFSGAEIGIDFTDAPDTDDLGGVSYYGSGEFALPYNLSVALDVSAFNFDVGISDISNITAHIIYGIDPNTSVGFFFGQDFVDDAESEILGGEIAYDYGLGTFEAYLGSGSDGADEDVTLYGFGASYALQSAFGVEATIDGYSGEGFSASAFEIGGFYQLDQGPKFGVTLGQVNLDAGDVEDDEWFFGLQASIAVGPNGGTTFGRRGTFQVVKTGVAETP